ncbi:MAG: UDP-N-acetylglucosamine 2-epimerase, partial [Candidatus Hydrothermarchaeales archaeon]
LNVPCITLRMNTERPETVEAGGNILAGTDTASILDAVKLVLTDTEVYEKMQKAKNPFGDGTTGESIVKILKNFEEKGWLKIEASDFTKGFWKRGFVKVDSKLDGKKVGELDIAIIKVIEDGKERFPSKDMVLKKGQIIEIIE